jgi:O-antigen ligase
MDSLIYLPQKISIERWVPLLLITTIFVTPLSSTGKSIFIVLSILAILLAPTYRAKIADVIVKPWCIAAFMLVALAVLGCLWSPASYAEQFLVVNKYIKLLYLPILVAGFSNARVRHYGIHAFMLAMLLTCIISTLKFYGFLQTWDIDFDNVFRNHIMTGFMVAFSSYLAAILACRQPDNTMRLLYIALAAFYSYHVLFVNGGRTGYIIYFLLMSLFVTQFFSLRKALAILLVMLSLFAVSYWQSAPLRGGIQSAKKQLLDYKYNKLEKDESIALRLRFHDFAQTLFEKHPITGNGTASFTHYFDVLKPVPEWVWRDGLASPHGLLEPHGQYWLVAAEFGVIGLLVLGYFFYSLFRASFALKNMRTIATGLLVFFLVGNLSDSLIFYSGSGYFFLLMMSICLGEQIEEDGCK